MTTGKPKPPGNPSPSGDGAPGRSFAALVEVYNEKLVRFLTPRLGDEQEARDVAQEAYVRLLGLDNEKIINHQRAYLFRIAANIAVDRLRAASRRAHMSAGAKQHDIQMIASTEPSAEAAILSKEKLALLRHAIAELPPKCRYAFLQYRMHGQTYHEIAVYLSVSESMVRKYVLRATRHCKSQLESED